MTITPKPPTSPRVPPTASAHDLQLTARNALDLARARMDSSKEVLERVEGALDRARRLGPMEERDYPLLIDIGAIRARKAKDAALPVIPDLYDYEDIGETAPTGHGNHMVGIGKDGQTVKFRRPKSVTRFSDLDDGPDMAVVQHGDALTENLAPSKLGARWLPTSTAYTTTTIDTYRGAGLDGKLYLVEITDTAAVVDLALRLGTSVDGARVGFVMLGEVDPATETSYHIRATDGCSFNFGLDDAIDGRILRPFGEGKRYTFVFSSAHTSWVVTSSSG